jgi:hypothetical protein
MLMFQITKTSRDSQKFISEVNLNGKGKSLQVTIALSRTISDGLALPTSKVDSIVGFYNMSQSTIVNHTVSLINEVCPIDVNAVLDYVLKFYRLRYASVFPSGPIITTKVETALVDFFKISSQIDPAAIKVIQENPMELMNLCNKFGILITEMVSE